LFTVVFSRAINRWDQTAFSDKTDLPVFSPFAGRTMSSKLNVVCAVCKRTYSVPLEWVGKAANCKCGNSVPIEVASMDAAAAPVASVPEPSKAPALAAVPDPAPLPDPSSMLDTTSTPDTTLALSAQPPSANQPTLGGAAVLQAEITSFTHTEIDDDGDYSISLKIRVTNTTSQNIEFLNSTAILLDGNRNPIHVSQSDDDMFITPGDSQEVDFYVGYLNAALMGNNPGQVTVDVYLHACSSDFSSLGTHAISGDPFVINGKQLGVSLGASATIHSLSAWCGKADEEGNGQFNIRVLAENITDEHIFKLQVKASLLESNGRSIEDTESFQELPERSTKLLDVDFWNINPKRLAGGSIDLQCAVYTTVGSGHVSSTGMTLETY
jgi:hypothetical protein